jgi:hypothetical protein
VKIKELIKASLPILLLCFYTVAFAQNGGKAEPLRIEIKRGATSAKVKGKIRGDEQAEYVFAARKGQQVTITLTSEPDQSALFELRAADGVDYKFQYNGRSWSGPAPTAGDYFLTVIRQTGKAERSAYSLTLTIR